MNVQVIMLVYDCENIIKKTIKSYVNKVGRILVFIDLKSNKKTIKEIKKLSSIAEIKYINFTTFDDTRNRCIEQSYDTNYKWTMFVDDSYILNGCLYELNDLNDNMVNIMIKDRYLSYTRQLIFKTECKFKYTGKIHEKIIYEGTVSTLNKCFIFDYKDDDSLKRTFSRVDYMLANTTEEHYIAMGHLQLFLMKRIDLETFKNKATCRCRSCTQVHNYYLT